LTSGFLPHRFSGTYVNRYDAAKVLSTILLYELPEKGVHLDKCVLAGIPRGGLYMVSLMSTEMNLPIDCAVIGKVGYPGHPECAMLAVDSDGKVTVNGRRDNAEFIESPTIRNIVNERIEEVRKIEKELRGDIPKPDFDGRPVIIVDDGIATGMTAKGAIYMVRDRKAGTVILATSVISPLAYNAIERQVDIFICPIVPSTFYAVSDFYEDFEPLSMEELQKSLKGANWFGG